MLARIETDILKSTSGDFASIHTEVWAQKGEKVVTLLSVYTLCDRGAFNEVQLQQGYVSFET